MNSLPLSQALLRYTLPWLQLPWPLDWRSVFAVERPLVLEIGFGNGAFLREQAQEHPDLNYVGVELAWRSVQRALKRLAQTDLDNVRIVEGDAQLAVRRLFAPRSLTGVFINFSDPWPKQRHHDRRLIQPAFVRCLAQRMKAGAQLCIATDHRDYARWIAGVLRDQTAFRSAFETPFVYHLPGRRPTKYEAKALEQGRTVHYFVWCRVKQTNEVEVPVERVKAEVEDVPNVLLKGETQLAPLLGLLSTRSWRERHREVEVFIKLEAVYLELDRSSGLVEVLVKEGGLAQKLGIVITAHGGGVLLKPATFGYPRPTWGVKRALWHVANLLLEQHGALEPVNSTVGTLKARRSEVSP